MAGLQGQEETPGVAGVFLIWTMEMAWGMCVSKVDKLHSLTRHGLSRVSHASIQLRGRSKVPTHHHHA